MKHMRALSVIIFTVMAMVFFGGTALAHRWETPRKILIFQRGMSGEAQRQIAVNARTRVLHMLPLIDGVAIELPSGRRQQALEALKQHSAVVGVYEDQVIAAEHVVSMTPVKPPTTELFPWGVERIGTPAIADLAKAIPVPGPRVAVVDTGIDRKHPELSKHIAGGYNARAGENPASYQDDNGHGTHMAGIIAAAANNQGIIGVASHPVLVAVKVLDQTGHGYLSDLINGLQWVAAKGIRVVNMSLSFSEESPLLEEVAKNLYQSGVIMVAAAGNRCVFGATDDGGDDDGGDDDGGDDDGGDSGCDLSLDPLQGGVKYPARYPWVIAVGATDLYNQVTSYSRAGPEVDVVAPGGSKGTERILSTIRGGGYGLGSGTSQAAAHVSGAVAVALQLAEKLSFEEVKDLLQTTAQDLGLPPEKQGAGLIAVDRMVDRLLGLQ
jgi:subtilisin